MASPNSDDNVALMNRIVMQIQQDANYDLVDTLFHPLFYNHTAEAGLPNDRNGVHAVMKYLHSAFADIEMKIEHCVTQGNIIATNKILTGGHVGSFKGVDGDGKRKRVRIMDFVTVEDGMIKEHWACVRDAEEVQP